MYISWLRGANPANLMSSIIRHRNGVIVISLRSKGSAGSISTRLDEEISSTAPIGDAALPSAKPFSPTEFQW
jgi:hypothetical protein